MDIVFQSLDSKNPYHLALELSGAVDPSKSRIDTSPKNLVVTLIKCQPVLWASVEKGAFILDEIATHHEPCPSPPTQKGPKSTQQQAPQPAIKKRVTWAPKLVCFAKAKNMEKNRLKKEQKIEQKKAKHANDQSLDHPESPPSIAPTSPLHCPLEDRFADLQHLVLNEEQQLTHNEPSKPLKSVLKKVESLRFVSDGCGRNNFCLLQHISEYHRCPATRQYHI